VRSWALSKLSDTVGNYIEFEYFENSTTGEFRIDEINYTGNAGQGLLPYNRVDFVYETRADQIKAYAAGGAADLTQRLSNVKVYAEETLFRDYRITYGTGLSARSRIASITECATDTACFKPTTFSWSSNGTAGMTSTALTGNNVPGSTYSGFAVVASGDFNKDGLTDLYWAKLDTYGRTSGTTNYIWLAKSDGTFSQSTAATSNSIPATHAVVASGDFNGDGLTDFYSYYSDAQKQSTGDANDYVYLNTGSGTFTRTAQSYGITGSTFAEYRALAAGDFNGDGITDIYAAKTRNLSRPQLESALSDYVFLGSSTGAFSNVGVTGPSDTSFYGYNVDASGDFNGDGLLDLYLVYQDSYGRKNGTTADSVWLATRTSDGTVKFLVVTPTSALSLPDDYRIAGASDFTGDGLTDLYVYKSDAYGRAQGIDTDYVALAKGDGSFEWVTLTGDGITGSAMANYKAVTSGDFTGDGLADVYLAKADTYGRITSTSGVLLASKGSGRFANQTIAVTGPSSSYPHAVAGVGDFNGNGLADIYSHYSDSYQRATSSGADDYLWKSSYAYPDLLTTITNGLSLATTITYKALTDSSVYTRGTGAVYPAAEVTVARYVVAQVSADNGIGSTNTQSYSYQQLRTHLSGEGSLGFAKMIAKDVASGITTTSNYSQSTSGQIQGMFTGSTVTASNGTVLEDKGLAWLTISQTMADGTKRHLRRIPYISATKRDLNGTSLGFTSESLTFDSYGFTLTHRVGTTYNGSSVNKYTVNSYTHDVTGGNWLMGRLKQSTVTHSETNKTSIIRTSSFTYDATTGLLASETIEPNDALFHSKTYTRNGFGAVTGVTESWGSPDTDGIEATSRTTSYSYDAKVRYRISETNPLGHSESNSYDAVTGLPTSSTGPNGILTSWAYDSFGRVNLETRAANKAVPTTTTTAREFCGGSVWCPTYGAIRIMTTATGAPAAIAYQDKLYRTIAAAAQSFDGRWVFVTTSHDSQGRVQKRSEPYFQNASTIYWTTIGYDTLGRPLTTTRPDGTVQSAAYNGLTVTGTNELGQTKTVINDFAGRMASVSNNAGNVTSYSYDATGQLVSMSGPGGTSTAAYDSRGNKIADSDPDKGNWTYRYNALGLIVEQTDAKGQVTAMTYDVLGRMLTRTDNAYVTSPSTASWTYDTAASGIGKLASAQSPGYSIVNAYDDYGRPVQSTETIDGTSSYSMSTSYDSSSLPEQATYPSGLVVRNVYNAQGYLAAVTNEGASEGYWRAVETDARGQVVKFTLGNGVETIKSYEADTGYLTRIVSTSGASVIQNLAYSYNNLGNLSQRQDAEQSLSESFAYDNLNRVTEIDTVYGAGQGTNGSVTLAYDASGNITSKSDVGAYAYGAPGSSCGVAYAGPHAVTATSGSRTADYCYDLNGNMLSGNGRTISWSSFDMPLEIGQGLNTVSFSYGPDRQRYKRIDTGTTGIGTTHYIGGKSYEQISRADGALEKKHYIGGVAVVSETVSGGASFSSTRYLSFDHLGSLDAVTDETGAVVERFTFDAFGKRRQSNWLVMSDVTLFSAATTTRGFTGHEMVDPVGLVHMNGRVYDPELGRFISADPVVQDLSNLQSWNRYSYVLNNPLSMTDPTGFFFGKIFKAIGNAIKSIGNAIGKLFSSIGSAIKAVLNKVPILRSVIQIGTCTFLGPIACVGAAGVLALASGGSLAGALQAMAFTVFDMGTWSFAGDVIVASGLKGVAGDLFGSLVHGAVGGGLSAMKGGSFMDGFIPAFASGMAAPAINSLRAAPMRIAASAIVGGTSSVLTGGKFVNGAVTAAFARMFNEEMHRSDATCGAAAGGAAAMCIGTAAAGVSCRRRVRHAPSPLQRR
jgi:RHS repeat-associated protein